MNYRMIKNVIGWILYFEAGFLIVPMITAAVYLEKEFFSFLICALICALAATLLLIGKPKSKTLYAKEGFVIVSLSWIVLSIFGALPFVMTGVTSSYIDALFETTSGFTTTGSTILSDVEILPRSILMWRSFTHWVGGMGVLVFIIAFLPLSGATNMHLMKAESTGPSVEKIVSKVKNTALILYSIYFVFTVLEFVLLLFGGMSLFDAINTAFATAGTGGFGIKNDSIGGYSSYIQIVVTVFMILFGINFNAFYLIFCRKIKDAFNAEVRTFLLIVIGAITVITINITSIVGNVGEALKHSAFTVASLISSTGYSTLNFDLWPELSRTILIMLMFIGACAGSTGGGIKVSRIMILVKGMMKELRQLVHPKQVKKITLDKRPVEHEVVRSVNAYMVSYVIIFAVSVLLISFENHDLVTNFTAVLTTLNNMGPGLSLVGPVNNFGFFSDFSKLIFIFNMIAGRLELFPMLILFSPATWKK